MSGVNKHSHPSLSPSHAVFLLSLLDTRFRYPGTARVDGVQVEYSERLAVGYRCVVLVLVLTLSPFLFLAHNSLFCLQVVSRQPSCSSGILFWSVTLHM